MTLRSVLPLLASLLASTALAQGPRLQQIEGTDAATGTEYTRIVLPGQLLSTSSLTPVGFTGTPALIAQCTRQSSGKQGFELFMSFGGATDLSFQVPAETSPAHSRPERVSLNLDFSGYTHVPLKRQWEDLNQPSGMLRYAAPGFHSANMEDAPVLLRYLVALPTLRLSASDRAAVFNTSPLLTAIRSEPRCKASLL